MSKLFNSFAIGACVGAGAGVLIHKMSERADNHPDKPLLPTAVTAALAGLDPLFRLGLIHAQGLIEGILNAGDSSDSDEKEDGGDHSRQEETSNMTGSEAVSTGFEAVLTDSAAPGGQGHPAGPGFAPTPD